MYVSLIQVSPAHQQNIQTYTIIINSAILDTFSQIKNTVLYAFSQVYHYEYLFVKVIK